MLSSCEGLIDRGKDRDRDRERERICMHGLALYTHRTISCLSLSLHKKQTDRLTLANPFKIAQGLSLLSMVRS